MSDIKSGSRPFASRPGRPTLGQKALTERVSVRVTPEKKKRLQAHARARRMTVSRLLERIINGRLQEPVPAPNEKLSMAASELASALVDMAWDLQGSGAGTAVERVEKVLEQLNELVKGRV
jgi:hypothetical protein